MSNIQSNDSRKPKTQRLLLAVRLVIGVALAYAAFYFGTTFPIKTAEFTTKILLVLPAIVVLSLAVWVSRNPKRTFWSVVTGVTLGWCIAPRVSAEFRGFWDKFDTEFFTIGIHMLGGALLAWIVEYIVSNRKRNLHTNMPDNNALDRSR